MFVSSGANRKILFWKPAWEPEENTDDESEVFGTNRRTFWRQKYAMTFSCPPNQLCFKPICPDDEMSFLAVAEKYVQLSCGN